MSQCQCDKMSQRGLSAKLTRPRAVRVRLGMSAPLTRAGDFSGCAALIRIPAPCNPYIVHCK